MSALDFPASPTTGQLFTGGNGVSYIWNGTLWLVQAGPGGGTGDFSAAYNGADYGLSGNSQVIIPPTVIAGNAGLWYSTSTGQYRPPAGRYLISAACSVMYAGGNSGGVLAIRKNGTALASSYQVVAANYTVGPSLAIEVEANGTDYFDMFLSGYNAGTVGRQNSFTAIPLTGMQGPMGPPFGGGTGDFCAQISGGIASSATTVVGGWATISGNTGSWFVPATGRWTPPSGRYAVYANMSATSTVAASVFALQLRKNGTVIVSSQSHNGGANYSTVVTAEINIDMNGTDWIDLQCSINTTGNASPIVFGAFPLTGMQGPQGVPFSGTPSLTAFLGSNVLLNNTSGVFDIVNTGSVGASGQMWSVSANGMCKNSAVSNTELSIFNGSTYISASSVRIDVGGGEYGLSLPAVVVTLTAPTTFTLRARDTFDTTGSILTTGGSITMVANKATWITAVRLS